MPLMCLLRPVTAGLLALLLVTAAGCSKTAKNSEAARPPATASQASIPPASPLPTSPAEPSKTLFQGSSLPHAGERSGVRTAGFETAAKPPVVTSHAASPRPPRDTTAPGPVAGQKQAVIPEPTVSPLPITEFQQLPAAPPSEPLPKPTQEAMDRPGVEPAPEPATAAGGAGPWRCPTHCVAPRKPPCSQCRRWARRRRSRLPGPQRHRRLRSLRPAHRPRRRVRRCVRAARPFPAARDARRADTVRFLSAGGAESRAAPPPRHRRRPPTGRPADRRRKRIAASPLTPSRRIRRFLRAGKNRSWRS